MKGIYIAPVDSGLKEHLGIYNKIHGQINAFKSLNVPMDYIGLEEGYIVYKDRKTEVKLNRAIHYLFFRYVITKVYDISKNYDFVYIRFSFANPYMFKLAKVLKNKGIKVFVEIPTFPYENELIDTFKNKFLKVLDKVLWKKNKNNVDKLIITTDKKELFDIECINIFNGIDVDNLHNSKSIKTDDVIRLIAVANISKWHGYDRVIKGLSKYYLDNKEKRKVEFYLVGEGEEKENLEGLTLSLNCGNYVKFLGAKHGDELDKIFDYMDIGVSSLALFRAGGGHDPIKSKEYLGRGIPVLLAYKDKAISESLPFAFYSPEDETDINIEEVIKEYENMNISKESIRKYAIENLSWKSQMRKVINELNN